MGDEMIKAGIHFYYSGVHARPQAFREEELDRYVMVEAFLCGHCGRVTSTEEELCRECGWPLPKEATRMLRLKEPQGPHMDTQWVDEFGPSTDGMTQWVTAQPNTTGTWVMTDPRPGPFIDPYQVDQHTHTINFGGGDTPNPNGGTTGMVLIRADDGTVQAEPFTMPAVSGNLAEFRNTGNNFFVCRQNGAVVDISLNEGRGMVAAAGTGERIQIKVNGRDTGMQFLTAGLDSRVNMRMPTTIPIAAGAAVQFQVVS